MEMGIETYNKIILGLYKENNNAKRISKLLNIKSDDLILKELETLLIKEDIISVVGLWEFGNVWENEIKLTYKGNEIAKKGGFKNDDNDLPNPIGYKY